MNNLELLYQNRIMDNQNVYSDSDSDNSEEKYTSNLKLITQQNYLIISSMHRDWTGVSKNTFSFNVKFNPVGNSVEENNKDGIVSLNNFKGQTDNTYINCNNKNIQSISITDIIIPNISIDTIDRLTTRYNSLNYETDKSYAGNKTLKDYPYILVKLEEINCVCNSTGDELNKSIGIMVLDEITNIRDYGDDYRNSVTQNGIKREISNIKRLRYRNIQSWKKLFYPVPLNNLNMLSISITDPNGNTLKLLNDYLTVKNISIVKAGSNINKIKIICDKYFSYYEYQEGDKLQFKNFKFNKNSNIFNILELETFVNRKEGHIIREVEINNNTLLTSNIIYINFPHKLNYDTGNIEYDAKYLISNNINNEDELYQNNIDDFGYMINNNLQVTLSFNLETLIHDSSIIKSNII